MIMKEKVVNIGNGIGTSCGMAVESILWI